MDNAYPSYPSSQITFNQYLIIYTYNFLSRSRKHPDRMQKPAEFILKKGLSKTVYKLRFSCPRKPEKLLF